MVDNTDTHHLSHTLKMLIFNVNAISSSWVIFVYLLSCTTLFFMLTFSIDYYLYMCLCCFRFSVVQFHANYPLSTQTQLLVPSNLNFSFATTGSHTLTVLPSSLVFISYHNLFAVMLSLLVSATRKFKSFQLKAGFWESIKSGYLQFPFSILLI